MLRQNAHQALEIYQDAIRLLLEESPDTAKLAYTRMQVNQAHNKLFTSLNQAMQEPGFNSHYLADMRLWVTHSQFVVEHINAMTILAREHYMLPENWRRSIYRPAKSRCKAVSNDCSTTGRAARTTCLMRRNFTRICH